MIHSNYFKSKRQTKLKTMSGHQEINSFFKKPGSTTQQSFILKGISKTLNSASKLDLNGLLELLSITNDINLQLKVFSALSAYLMCNKGANIDVIIKCNAVYDKLNNILSRGLPRKSTEALNFLSALLYINAEEDGTTKRRTLAIYAQNMTRVSGCLSAMCEMFTNCMLYHDTWKALCQCLAIACSGSEMNQSYCSHLIPVSIQKCSQVNIDTLLVLQSLLLNHRRNSILFLDSNGVKIFTRELLHYDKCLQLLTTIVQCPRTSTLLAEQTNVLSDLRDFLRLYGPNSQLGQKAIIILNHISSSAPVQEKEIHQNTITSETSANQSLVEIDTAKKSLNENDINAKTANDFEETKVLIQNVMKEMFIWKQNELNLQNGESKSVLDAGNKIKRTSIANNHKLSTKSKQLSNKTNILSEKRTNEIIKLAESNRRNRLQCNIASELSFSFLQNDEFQVPKNPKPSTCFYRSPKHVTQRLSNDNTQQNDTTFYGTISDTRKTEKQTTTLQDFSPIFASTPKHTNETEHFTEATVNSYKTTAAVNKQNKYHDLKIKRQKAKRETQKNKAMKNRSLGARFFGAINESCTTFVKTVKNIFSKKESPNDSRSASPNSTINTAIKDKWSNYSFMHYMRKRDAVLNDNWMKNKNIEPCNFSIEANSCKTCDDTAVLKQKLTKDEFLKQTVKKLKLGINLYGCDFKKISKTMWPRETYMTPLVLYNLYRKLLLK